MKRSFFVTGVILLSSISSIIGLPIAPADARARCADFPSQEAAQAYMQQNNARYLDGDSDGVACESLPRQGDSAPTRPVTPPVTPISPATPPASVLSNLTVVSVGDGDTLRVSEGDPCGNGGAARRFTVRLGCIDAPEANQPGGRESATRLRQLLPQGQRIQLRRISVDRYGRTVGEVYFRGSSLNLQLVHEGQAVVYRQFLSGCRPTQNQYLQAERQAQAARRGFWQQQNPVMPWQWRR
jgi:endonuclease YncB( thermonuclease family)